MTVYNSKSKDVKPVWNASHGHEAWCMIGWGKNRFRRCKGVCTQSIPTFNVQNLILQDWILGHSFVWEASAGETSFWV